MVKAAFWRSFSMTEIKIKYVVEGIESGGTPTSSVESNYDDNGIPWVAIKDMSTSDYVFDTNKKLSNKGLREKNLRIFPSGTILYSIYATIGKVSELRVPSSINQAILALIENHEKIDKRYFKYSLRSIEDMVIYDASTNTQANLNAEKVKNTKIPFLNLGKQVAVALFLDKTLASIDEVLIKEQKCISALIELRKKNISEIVLGEHLKRTRKDTGIDWMRTIPTDWKIGKIGSNCYLKGRIGWQGLTADEYKEEGPYLITGTDFDCGKINWKTCVHITNKRYVEASHISVKNGDVLITKDGTVGKVALVNDMPSKASLNSGVMLMRNLYGNYLNKYLFYVLQSHVFWDWFLKDKKENSTIIHLYQEQFEKFSFPLPPKDEQETIVDLLDKRCETIDRLMDLKTQKIEKLKEYKKSLIYECVTGRREV